MASQSAPYRPTNQALGGTPDIIPDIPVCAVFMLLYLIAGIWHQVLLIQSKKRKRGFGFCGMMGGLCWIRLVTGSLRIAWAVHPTNVRLGIAAAVFVNVGTVLLYFVDLFFAQRIVRAQHPRFGWSKFFNPIIPILCVVTVLTVIMVIVVSIQSFYTLSTNTRRIDHDVQLYVETAFAVIAFIPFVLVITSTLVRQIPKIKHTQTEDKFGSGSMRAKIILVCIASLLLATADSIKAGTAYLPSVPLFVPGSNPPVAESTPWYYSRGIFFGLGFAPEIIVLYMYAAFQCSLRFVVPDGAKGPYSYAGGFTFAGEAGNEKSGLGNRDSTRNLFGSQPSLAESGGTSGHTSRMGRNTRSRAESVISWGGISRERFEPGIGEDGIERVPYSGIDDDLEIAMPQEFHGAEQEMGWNPHTGQWELRQVSDVICSGRWSPPSENHV